MKFFYILNYFRIYNFSKEHPENSKDKEGNNFYTWSKHNPMIIDFSKNNANFIFDLRLSKTEKENTNNEIVIKNICIKNIYNKNFFFIFIWKNTKKILIVVYMFLNIKM